MIEIVGRREDLLEGLGENLGGVLEKCWERREEVCEEALERGGREGACIVGVLEPDHIAGDRVLDLGWGSSEEIGRGRLQAGGGICALVVSGEELRGSRLLRLRVFGCIKVLKMCLVCVLLGFLSEF